MQKVTSDMLIGDILRIDTGTVPVFLENGMHCLGCPSAQGESLEEACMAHGIDPEKLVKELNNYFEKKA